MTDETWAPCLSHVGYLVSDQGRVRSLDRRVRRGNGWLSCRGRMRALHLNGRGYLFVPMPVNQPYTVHRLVLEAFVGPRPEGMECRHLNGDPLDNRLVNLAWDTHSENMLDLRRHGTHPKANRTHCPLGHRLTAPNLVAGMGPRQRGCLACSRTPYPRSRPGFKEESDRRYAAILAGGTCRTTKDRCKRGHPLAGFNITQTNPTRRRCYSCSLASSWARHLGITDPDRIQAEADRRFQVLSDVRST